MGHPINSDIERGEEGHTVTFYDERGYAVATVYIRAAQITSTCFNKASVIDKETFKVKIQ